MYIHISSIVLFEAFDKLVSNDMKIGGSNPSVVVFLIFSGKLLKQFHLLSFVVV